MNKIIKKVPLIISDIDGVFLQRRNPLPGAQECIKFLKDNHHIPQLFMTNRTGYTEQHVANVINMVYNIKDPFYMINKEQIIMSHSMMRDIVKDFNNKNILVYSKPYDNFEEFMNHIGIKHFITTQEYGILYPEMIKNLNQDKQEQQKTLDMLEKRLEISKQDILQEPLQVASVFLMTPTSHWEESLQIVLDVLSSEDGKVIENYKTGSDRKHIPVYSAFDDFVSHEEFKLPRLSIGAHTEALKMLYKRLYEADLDILNTGKPDTPVFKYAEHYAQTNQDFKDLNLSKDYHNFEITNKYMIGDNPESDIKGANNAGQDWTSILVRSGVFKGEGNDEKNPATYVVDNVTQALQLICELEKIPNKL